MLGAHVLAFLPHDLTLSLKTLDTISMWSLDYKYKHIRSPHARTLPVSRSPQIIHKCLWVFPQIKQIKREVGSDQGSWKEYKGVEQGSWTVCKLKAGASWALLLAQKNRHAMASWKPLREEGLDEEDHEVCLSWWIHLPQPKWDQKPRSRKRTSMCHIYLCHIF